MMLWLVIIQASIVSNPELGIAHQATGVRALAMGGAHRGIGTSNDTITLNPAGLAVTRRYCVDLQYSYSPQDRLGHYELSALDSKSSPVAAAVAYSYVHGDPDGLDASIHKTYGSVGFRLTENVALGVTARHIRGSYREDGVLRAVSIYDGDLGLRVSLPWGLAVGLTYNDALEKTVPGFPQASLGAGLSLERGLLVVGSDIEVDVKKSPWRALAYRFGAEYFLAQAFPVRAGFSREEPSTNTGAAKSALSLGLAWVTQQGGVDLSFLQPLKGSPTRRLVMAMKYFL